MLWSVSDDNALLDFFPSGKLVKRVNATAIILVSKTENASSMTQFQPISCCNTKYKCITKLIAKKTK